MISRRAFNNSLCVGAFGSTVFATSANGKVVSPNDKIQLGFIGVGTMGRGH
ncbi:MAG: hypothetical protein RIR17_1244, partial [Planctomycetota bacterium]